jgi:hypothetical protein
METKQITLKNWANNTNYIGSQNVTDKSFLSEFETLKNKMQQSGYKQLNIAFDTLHGRNALRKVIVYAWYWRGNWSDATKGIYTVFYK